MARDDPSTPAGAGAGGASAPRRPQVIYVMGAGRSGSTTLGIALGNCVDVFYAGELDNWLPRGGEPQVDEPERVAFWARVRGNLEAPDAAQALYGPAVQRVIERSLSLARVNRWPARRRLRPAYREVAADVYRAIVRTSARSHVADTSHYPLRARELQRVPEIDLYLILLVRSPQGVVASFNRRDVAEFEKSTLHTNLYLLVTHALALLVFLAQPRTRRLFVRYETFLADPEAAVRQILTMSGCEDVQPPDFAALDIGVPLQGNRVTRERSMTLRPSSEAIARRSVLTAILQAPMMALLSCLRPSVAAARKRGVARPERAPARE